MSQPSRRERVRYAFDNFMARGTIALIAGLFVVAAFGIIAITLVVGFLGLAGPKCACPTCCGTA